MEGQRVIRRGVNLPDRGRTFVERVDMSDSTPPTAPVSKICTGCARRLPLTDFFVDKQKPDGKCSRCKDCHREASQRYRANNRDAGLKYGRQYRESHRDEISAYHRRIRLDESFRERESEAHHAWYVIHRERVLANNHAWQRANREKVSANHRAHPEWWKVSQANRRARLAGASGTHTSEDVLTQYQRQRGRCFWCGNRLEDLYHVDHVTPLALGGGNGMENLVVACAHCNQSKNAKHPIEWAGVLL